MGNKVTDRAKVGSHFSFSHFRFRSQFLIPRFSSILACGHGRISGRRFSPRMERSDDRKYVCVRRLIPSRSLAEFQKGSSRFFFVYHQLANSLVQSYNALFGNFLIYPKLNLPTLSESNAWDFNLVMIEISENIPATSEYFRRFSEDFRCTKMFRRLLSTSEAIQRTTIFALCNIQLGYKVNTKQVFGTFSVKLNRIFVIIMC